MKTYLLDNINSPDDIRKLNFAELDQLAQEIRAYLIETVSITGGHLSSNLGVVELTLALHKCFHSPEDKIIFDVGHQSYTHKIITGRKKKFNKLRQKGGLSGFPAPAESAHDVFITGHASTSLSVAIGMARAKKIKNEPGWVITVLGDGAYTGGLVQEAINNVGNLDNLIVILNDNNMSISKNVGAFAHYFTNLRTSPKYNKAKIDVKHALEHTPVIGKELTESIRSVKSVLKRSIYHTTLFEEMGFFYAGPADGHDIPELCYLFENIKQADKPVFIHLETKKGKGFLPAENNPGAFHGVTSFDARKVADPDVSPKDSYSTVFGQMLAQLADEDDRICAITAAMKYGTGLQYMKKAHLDRFFDVGLAEEHAVTFAAGLAASGLVPVVAIYSTFLQRAYDQIIHDVVLSNLNVLFAIDRAGIVPGDGETHQGIYDAAFLSQQQDMPIVSPSNYAELAYWLKILVCDYDIPRAIRYPRGSETRRLGKKPCSGALFDKVIDGNGTRHAIVTYGRETEQAMKAAEILQNSGHSIDVIQMVLINPIPKDLIEILVNYENILFAEEGISQGGIGEHLAVKLYMNGYKGDYDIVSIPEKGIDHAQLRQIRKQYGLDASSLAARVLSGISE